MDRFALGAANHLVGNAREAAGLEITLIGPTLQFERETLIAICGGDLSPTLAGNLLPHWRPVNVSAGAVLSFGQCAKGCRAYLAVAGGIDVPTVLGGRGTHLRARFGGFHGRALRAGDVLESGNPSDVARELMRRGESAWKMSPPPLSYRGDTAVRMIRGAFHDRLTDDSRRHLLDTGFTISPQSDRMGYRLRGPRLELAVVAEPVSEPVCPGTIQLPPEGQPIVLMADCQTTGGYPRIGHVITVDLPLLAQLKPGDRVRFAEISVEDAQRAWRAHTREWEEWKEAIARWYQHP